MIAFIEGRMQIPMGRVTRDFLIFYRLCPTQRSPNIFRILGNVDMLNRKMGVNLTHHDVNWVYSCQNSKDMRYSLYPKLFGFYSILECSKIMSCLKSQIPLIY